MKKDDSSKEIYETIPEGGYLFSIDKIGLRIETNYLNKNNLEPWKTSNIISVLTFGETAQINIHAEFEPWEEHLGKKCFDAVCLLLSSGVFNMSFTIPFLKCFQGIIPFIVTDKSWYIRILLCFFKPVEWEWAWDFLDNPLFSFIDNNSKNKKGFKKVINSSYSKDGKVIRRIKEKNGKNVKLSKGRQKSLVIIYDRAEKIGSERPIERVEIRQQGKHKKDLSMELLNGTKEDAISKALPLLKKSVNNVIHPDSLKLTDYWQQNAPSEYMQVFSQKD